MAKEATIKININTQNAINSIDELNNEFNGTLSTINDLRIASKSLSEELESTPVGTAKFQELQQALIDVNTKLKDYELSIEALDNEQLASEIKSVVGGLTDMAGGLVLVGVSSENMEKVVQTFAKVEGVSRAATGAMEVWSSGIKIVNSILTRSAAAQEVLAGATAKSTLANSANAGSTVAMGAASSGAAVKVRALTAAMMANPWMLLATAVIAVVSAIMIFGDEEETAAEQSDKLTDSLEKQNKTLEQNANLFQATSDVKSRRAKLDIDFQNEINEQEIKNLESVTDKTKQQIADLDVLYNIRKENKKILLEEDKAAEEAALIFSKNQIEERISDEKIYRNKLLKLKQSADEEELDALNEKIDESTNKELEYKLEVDKINALTVKDKQGLSDLDKQLLLDKIKVDNEELARQEKVRQDNIAKRRSELLKEINDTYSREKTAGEALANLNNQQKDDLQARELEYLDITYGQTRDKFIEGATKREVALLDDKFMKGLVSQKTYEDERIAIENKGFENLTKKEQEYLNSLDDFNAKRKVKIEQRFSDEADITIKETKKINDETELMRLEYAKAAELIEANKITIATVKETQILNIKRKYAAQEISLRNKIKDDSIDILTKQLEIELADTTKTAEEKLKIQAKYNKDVEELNRQASQEAIDINGETVQSITQQWDVLADNTGKWVSAISAPIVQAMDIVSTVFDDMNTKAQASIEDTYNKGTEGLNKLLGEQLISREEYDNKIAILDQQKREREKAEARKAFKQQKALQIVNATIQGAQAVLSAYAAGAAVPIIGPITTGPAFAGIAGALAATQIGLIASQKFTAARGGKVPGQPSKTDSVDALLAPGEMVINSSSSAMFAPLLSAINTAGGGVPLAPSEGLLQPQKTNTTVYVENGSKQDVRAYVVESDISSSMKRVDKLRNNAKF